MSGVCVVCGKKNPLNKDGRCLYCVRFQSDTGGSWEYVKSVRRKRVPMATVMGRRFQLYQKAQEIHRARDNDRQRCMAIAIEYIVAGRAESDAKTVLEKKIASEDDQAAMMADLHPPEEEQIGEEVLGK